MKYVFTSLFLLNAIAGFTQVCLHPHCINPWHYHNGTGHSSTGLVYISGGVTPMQMKDGLIQTHYIDESPSQDQFFAETVITSSTQQINFGVGVDFQGGQTSGFFIRLGGDISFGQLLAFDGELGIGHAMNLGKLANFKFLVVCSYGRASLKLGDLYQNEDFIEVNNARFFSPTVEINLSREHVIARPEIELSIPFKSYSKTSVFFNAGYQFPIKTYTNRLVFKGENYYGEGIREEESLMSNNLIIEHDEQSITNNFVEIGGFVLKGGFSVRF